jgi:starvation-inducible DNA-binding protein
VDNVAFLEGVLMNTGISKENRERVAKGLAKVLAESYVLYLKTHNFHWNVTGANFVTLHALFEEQYQALAVAVDDIAERIRALGFPAPGSYSQFSELSSIRDETGVPSTREMLEQLLQGHETIILTARAMFTKTNEAGDAVTEGLLVDRLEAHEKTAWMLRSLLLS